MPKLHYAVLWGWDPNYPWDWNESFSVLVAKSKKEVEHMLCEALDLREMLEVDEDCTDTDEELLEQYEEKPRLQKYYWWDVDSVEWDGVKDVVFSRSSWHMDQEDPWSFKGVHTTMHFDHPETWAQEGEDVVKVYEHAI